MLESIGNTIAAALSNLPFVSRSGGLTELVDVQNGENRQGFGVTDIRVISPGIAEVTIGGKNARTAFLLKAHAEREGASLTENSKSEVS